MVANGAQKAIKLLSTLKSCVEEYSQFYSLLPDLIEQEHSAIRENNLDRIEQIAKQKLEVGDHIETVFGRMKSVSAEVVELYCDFEQVTVDHTATLSDCLSYFERISKRIAGQTEESGLFEHMLQKLRDAVEILVEVQQSGRDNLEVNKSVLTKLLKQRQENYRFWQNVAADVMSSYNDSGKQKSSSQNSVISVKA